MLTTHLFRAVYERNLAKVQEILQIEQDPDLLSYELEKNMWHQLDPGSLQPLTALMLACNRGDVDLVELLLTSPHINLDYPALHSGQTAFFFLLRGQATKAAQCEIAKLLIDKKAISA